MRERGKGEGYKNFEVFSSLRKVLRESFYGAIENSNLTIRRRKHRETEKVQGHKREKEYRKGIGGGDSKIK